MCFSVDVELQEAFESMVEFLLNVDPLSFLLG